MRILLINFVMDQRSPVLAWQQGVAARLAARCERLVVMTERTGRYDLPANVEVHRVPRVLMSPVRVLGTRHLMNLPVWRWCAKHRFDAVFVHMNADWVYRLAPCWRHFRLPVLMWYAHGTVTDRLHRAHEHATCVITSSPEGFRIPSDKVRVIGQGIDTALFTPPASRPDGATIVAVGRISRRKSLHAMLDTLAWLRAHAPQYPFTLRLIGPTLTRDDSVYRAELHETIRERGLASCVRIEGPRAPDALPAVFASAFLHLNLSRTGSMDKAILESLACGCPTLTSNESVSALLADVPELIVRDTSPEALGRQICEVYERRHTLQAADLRALVAGKHDLDAYVDRVHGILSELAGRTSASQPAAVPPSSRGRHLPIMDAR